jgi:cysteine-rich PDZ-binding protein
MVCESCQKKVTKLVVPDKWKEGARNCVGSSSSSGGVVKAGKTNKALAGQKFSLQKPEQRTCRICKSKLQLAGMHYCNDCAHKKGICTMCGKKCVDTSKHNMSLV